MTCEHVSHGPQLYSQVHASGGADVEPGLNVPGEVLVPYLDMRAGGGS